MNSTPASALRNGNRGFAPGVVRAGTVAWHLVGIALAVLLAGWVAGRLMPVLLPVGIAVLLSALLRPLAAGLERRGVAPAPAAIGSVALALVIIAGLAWLIVPPFVAQLSDLGTSLDDGMRRLAYSLGHDVAGLDHAQVDRMLHDAGQSIRQNLGGLAGSALAGAAAVLALIPTAVLVVFVCFFLVKDGRRIWSWLLALVPEARRSDVDEMGSRAWSVLGVYAKGVVFVATIDAVFIGIALLIVGVPLALPLIVLTWLAAFFPIIGGVAAGAAAVLVALVAKGLGSALIVLGAIIAVQQLEGNVLYPLLVGPRLKLHPIVVLTVVAVGGTIAGIPGAFLAVPVATVGAAMLGYVREQRSAPATRFDRPAGRGLLLRNGRS